MVFQTVFEGQTLFKGRTGYAVSHWQYFLKSIGFYKGAIDGIFEEETLVSTTNYQKDRKIHARRDGLVEKTTYNQADSEGFNSIEGSLLEEVIGLREILAQIMNPIPLEVIFSEKQNSVRVKVGSEILTLGKSFEKIKGYFESYIYGGG